MESVIWISWEEHRRTREICNYFGIELFVLKDSRGRARRYASLLHQTARLLRQRKPKVLIVQNPSVVLSLFTCLLKRRHKYKLVIDAHNEAIEPYVLDTKGMRALARCLTRCADLTIVTNRQLARKVDDAGGNPVVLPDRIPTARSRGRKKLSSKFNIALIATFAKDEPIGAVFQAAADYDKQIAIYVTGNSDGLNAADKSGLPPNIIFTGYLSDADYWSLLNSVDAIIDLTEMDNCLVCGAYEAVAVGKPLILSDNKATREYFRRGVIYSKNSVADIKRGFSIMLEKQALLAHEMIRLKDELAVEWEEFAKELTSRLNTLGASPRSQSPV